ncbi:MAG: phosphohydrolase [Candidatus Muiribacterium halophilum]|uniref:Phosphohydrolase n=1 Tax=Muiribacterium halophilum TaxID=2053465 RepID=A0A2N5Z935_MUIH1|nr:MAG: phosphohydrolase [Candidatus Muirbacterium halophilum]
MTREKALNMVKDNIKTENLVKHSLAVEGIMRHYAEKFEQDVDTWGLAGLLHDLDYEKTKDFPEKHGFITKDMLEGLIEHEIIQAILAHPGHFVRTSLMDKVLYACDPLSGFIVACALMAPDKNIENVDLKFMKKRFKSKGFARGASREQMSSCIEFNENLDDFLNEALFAMKKIRNKIGL